MGQIFKRFGQGFVQVRNACSFRHLAHDFFPRHVEAIHITAHSYRVSASVHLLVEKVSFVAFDIIID